MNEQIIQEYYQLAQKAGVDPSHSVDHVRKVLNHCQQAIIARTEVLPKYVIIAINIAAILHEADDRKFFKTTNHKNAQTILEKYYPSNHDFQKLVIRMISLVSCSENGNVIPQDIEDWMLIPRWADRLEAIGCIGIWRAYSYTLHVNRPLFTTDTPRVTNYKELNQVATADRFANYLKRKSSDSFIDHFYDKLFHIVHFEEFTDNEYILQESTKRRLEMENFIFEFGKTGEIPVKMMDTFISEYLEK